MNLIEEILNQIVRTRTETKNLNKDKKNIYKQIQKDISYQQLVKQFYKLILFNEKLNETAKSAINKLNKIKKIVD